ncbi:MAG: hypothetical protein ABW006_02565 [Hyphomicrobium sp.]
MGLQSQLDQSTDGFGSPRQIVLLSAPVIDVLQRRYGKANIYGL